MGETNYNLKADSDNSIVEASSDNSASGLHYKKTLPITADTRLSWRWKINNTWPAAVETSKAGDDFPVHLNIVISDAPLFLAETHTSLCLVK